MEIVSVQQAKTHFASLMQRAVNGEEIIVAKHGKPMLRLVPVTDSNRPLRQFGRHKHHVSQDAVARAVAPLTEEELGDWEAK